MESEQGRSDMLLTSTTVIFFKLFIFWLMKPLFSWYAWSIFDCSFLFNVLFNNAAHSKKRNQTFWPPCCAKKGSVLHRISYSYVRGLCVSQTYPYLQFDEHNFKFWSYCSWIIYDAQACFQREIVLFLICFLWGTQTDMYQPAVGLFPLSFRWSDQLAKTRVTRTLFGSWQMFALETKSDLIKTFRRPRWLP